MAAPRPIAIVGAAIFPALAAASWDAVEDALSRTGWDGGPEGLMLAIGLFIVSWGLTAAWLARASARPVEDGLWAGAVVAAVMLLMVVPLLRGYGWFVMVPWAMFAGLAVACSGVAGGVAAAWQGDRPPLWTGAVTLTAGVLMAAISLLFTPFAAQPRMLLIVVFIWSICGLVIGGGAWLIVRTGARAGP